MGQIGIHASHEMHSPRELLVQVQRAESAGFCSAMCSDHFHPWAPQQGNSGHSFTWLGAALQATSFDIGTICYPAGRYHPAVVAQSSATLSILFPGRHWLALGTGQALNDCITGESWPEKHERQARVKESAAIIRDLWAGEMVHHHGSVVVEHAKLYSRPEVAPKLFGAALSPETANWVAGWADGLLTAMSDLEKLRAIVDAFRSGGGEGKPMYLQSMVGYDREEKRAWESAKRNWPIAGLDPNDLQTISSPEELARRGREISLDDLRGSLRVSSSLEQHRQWLAQDLELGFDRIFLFSIGDQPAEFVDVFGAEVLPHFARQTANQSDHGKLRADRSNLAEV